MNSWTPFWSVQTMVEFPIITLPSFFLSPSASETGPMIFPNLPQFHASSSQIHLCVVWPTEDGRIILAISSPHFCFDLFRLHACPQYPSSLVRHQSGWWCLLSPWTAGGYPKIHTACGAVRYGRAAAYLDDPRWPKMVLGTAGQPTSRWNGDGMLS